VSIEIHFNTLEQLVIRKEGGGKASGGILNLSIARL
jgi:hypothetical protein